MRRHPWLLSVMLFSVAAAAEETIFHDVQFPSAKGELANATLRFSDDDRMVEVRVSDGRVLTVQYSQVDTMSYEYTKKHRLKQAVALGML